MNKKGFTLIELLAVIVLLSLLGIFTVSTVLEKTEEKREQIDKTSEQIIKSAAINYVKKNIDNYDRSSGNVYCINASDILSSEKIEDLSANTKEQLSNNLYVKVTFSLDNATYDIVNTCTGNVDALPNSPVLLSNMIPITWDKSNNVIIADQSNWYNYAEKKWANAMIVPKSLLSKYKSMNPGDLAIPFNEIVDEAIFVVWIPSFSFSLGSSTTIKFEKGISSEAHPAFNNISGFWVSKFEVTKLNDSLSSNVINSSYSQVPYMDTKNNLDSAILSISENTNYGFVRNEAYISMISNYEWAAVSYLANSRYGVGNEKVLAADKYTGTIQRAIVGKNNTENVSIIPLSYSINSSLNYTSEIYYSEGSVFASSNHNVTGVYDLNGGENEWVKDNESSLSRIYSSDAAALKQTNGRMNSYYSSYVPGSGSQCLTRGGSNSKNGIFAYEFYPCEYRFSTRITIK